MKELSLEEKILLHVANIGMFKNYQRYATQISKELDIPLSTTTDILNKLEKDGFFTSSIDGKYRFYYFKNNEIHEKVKLALETLKEVCSMIS